MRGDDDWAPGRASLSWPTSTGAFPPVRRLICISYNNSYTYNNISYAVNINIINVNISYAVNINISFAGAFPPARRLIYN